MASKKNKKDEEETVTIPKSLYDKLVEDSTKLEYLDNYGVDNWGGYSDAITEALASLGRTPDE